MSDYVDIMENELIKLGFNKAEALTYLALLDLGQSSAGPIVKEVGMHRQQIYDALAVLKRNNLVSEVVKKNRKHWTASHPQEVVRQISEKESLAEKILPSLAAQYNLSANKQEVKVYDGISGFITVHKINIKKQPKNTSVPVVGANGWNWVEQMRNGHYLKPYEKTRIGKNITHQLVFFEKERANTIKLVKKYFGDKPAARKREYRFLPDYFESPVGMQIWHDNITLIIYQPTVLVIQITNRLVVENFRKYFELLWKMAKK